MANALTSLTPYMGTSIAGTMGLTTSIYQAQKTQQLAMYLGNIEAGYPQRDCYCHQPPPPCHHNGNQSNGMEQLLPLLLLMGMGGAGNGFGSPFAQGNGFGSPFAQDNGFGSPFAQDNGFGSPFAQGNGSGRCCGSGGGGNEMMLLMLLMMMMQQQQQQQQQNQGGYGGFGGPKAGIPLNFTPQTPNSIPFPARFLQKDNIADGEQGGVKFSSGNPSDWYFKHGEHTKTDTDLGWIDEGGNTRIVYDKENNTGFVYKKAHLEHSQNCCCCSCKSTSIENGWQLSEVRRNWEGKSASPIILDLDGNGAPDVAGGNWKPHAGEFDSNRTAMFDINGDGKKERTEWAGPNDGLLVYDKDGTMNDRLNKNGSLEISGKELLGDEGGKYKDGYEKMRKLGLDSDGSGAINGDELSKLNVWKDLNGNGTIDTGELSSTEALGISSINTNHDGNYKSTFTRNGQEQSTWDWWPSYLNN